MKGGPDPSPSQGQHLLPSFMYKNATKFKIYVIEKEKKLGKQYNCYNSK